MKRLISMVLCLMIIAIASASMAADLTLPVKLERQMQHDGNGVKGSFTIHANAEKDKDPIVYAMQNAEFNILRNASEKDWHLILFQTDDAEQQINRTELYKNGDIYYLRSDFAEGNVYRISAETLFATLLDIPQGENPSILPSLLSMLVSGRDTSDSSSWDTVISRYGKMLEIWMGEYMAEPELTRGEDDSQQMILTYVVPYTDACGEIASLMATAAQDPDVIALADTVLTPEQKNIFLNPYMESFYAEALKSFPVSGDIRFVKTVTALGEMIASQISVPLPESVTGFKTLTMESRAHMTGYTLTGENQVIRLIFPENTEEITEQEEYGFTAYMIRYDRDNIEDNTAWRIDVSRKTEKSYDEENSKEHEIHHYTASAVRDTENLPDGLTDDMFPEKDSISATLDLHYSGKVGPNAPTTLNIDARIVRGDLDIQVNGKIKTASTWPFVPFSTDQAVILSSLNDETAKNFKKQWLENASESVLRLEEAQMQIVEGE